MCPSTTYLKFDRKSAPKTLSGRSNVCFEGKRMANRSKFNIPCDETARELKKQLEKKAHNISFGIESLDQIPEFQVGIMLHVG